MDLRTNCNNEMLLKLIETQVSAFIFKYSIIENDAVLFPYQESVIELNNKTPHNFFVVNFNAY